MRFFITLVALFLSFNSFAANKASVERPQGGTFTIALVQEPNTLNPISYTDGYAPAVFGYCVDTLLNKNIDTWEWEPALAEKWEISKDHKTFTFHLRDNLKWSDGKPLTTEDVKFSFDAIKDKRYKAMAKMPYLEGIDHAEIVDAKTIKFITKTDFYDNFEVVASGIVTILPKHIYQDPEAKVGKTVVGSGPYMIDTYEKGRRIILKKNPLWWGWEESKKKGEYNFEKIAFRFVDSPNVQLEMLKKGDIDYMELQPEQYVQNTSGPEWGKSVIKVKTKNEGPKGYNWIGYNLKNEIFKDQKVRLALAHLVNRDLMIQKFKFGLAEKTKGPGIVSEYESKNLKAIDYNPKKALELLHQAGWADNDKNGVLEKTIDGKKVELKFEVLIATDIWTRYLTVFKEDAQKVGVNVSIKQVEWNTFSKLLNEGKFDTVAMAWGGGGIEWDPKQIWHSDSRGGGSNYINYSNPEVDKLIDQARLIWDRKKRAKILQKVNDLIADDVPYIFLFNPSNVLYAHRSTIEKPKDTFKYSVGTSFWWMKK